jgi:hypothetical protein
VGVARASSFSPAMLCKPCMINQAAQCINTAHMNAQHNLTRPNRRCTVAPTHLNTERAEGTHINTESAAGTRCCCCCCCCCCVCCCCCSKCTDTVLTLTRCSNTTLLLLAVPAAGAAAAAAGCLGAMQPPLLT